MVGGSNLIGQKRLEDMAHDLPRLPTVVKPSVPIKGCRAV